MVTTTWTTTSETETSWKPEDAVGDGSILYNDSLSYNSNLVNYNGGYILANGTWTAETSTETAWS